MTYRACLLYIHLTVNKRNKKALETQTQENIYHLWFSRMVVRMDIENVDIGILGYCDRRILFLNLGCWYNPQILVNTVLHGHVRGCGKVIWGGNGGIVTLASWEKHFIMVCENLLQYPRTLYPLLLLRLLWFILSLLLLIFK